LVADTSAYAISLLLIALGVRVHRHARRAGALPDEMVASFFVCLGLGTVPALLGGRASIIPMELDQVAHAIGHALLSLGIGALALFVWKCFGPSSTWRKVVAITTWLSLAGLYAAQGIVDGFRDGEIIRVTAVVRGLVLGWAFVESLRYRRQLRRRLALGLADPVVANRFTLWCLWTGSLFLCLLVLIAFRWLVGGIDDASASLIVVLRLTLLSLGLTSAVSLFLAFFPPRRYSDLIRSRALA
jgi:hypothetical protein